MSNLTATNNTSRFRVVRAGAFNLPVGTTRIQFNLTEFDHLNEYDDAATYLFTPIRSGVYLFCANITTQNPLAGTQTLKLIVRGTTTGNIAQQQIVEDGTINDQFINVAGMRYLIAGQPVEAVLFNIAGAARLTVAAFFSGFRIG
jgi:hypothetical protein